MHLNYFYFQKKFKPNLTLPFFLGLTRLADYEAKNPRAAGYFEFTNNEPVIRICREDEQPTDLLTHTVVPIVVGLLLASLLASFCLQILGDDFELYRWLGIVSPSLIKDLLKLKLFNQELNFVTTEEEKMEKEKTNRLLEARLMDLIGKANPQILNHQDRVKGNLGKVSLGSRSINSSWLG
jgi:hypothetical protein